MFKNSVSGLRKHRISSAKVNCLVSSIYGNDRCLITRNLYGMSEKYLEFKVKTPCFKGLLHATTVHSIRTKDSNRH